MIIRYSDFLDLKYKPRSTDLVCLFRISPAREFSMKEAAARVASESSNGTWTGLKVPSHISKLSAKCFKIKGEYAWIAYPGPLFERGNMPQVVSSIMGNIFGMKAVRALRLEDVSWPRALVKSFRGPKYGLKGIRRLLGVNKRPITATVPKPKTGYYPNEHARVGYDAWTGGVELLKDDENLSGQVFNPFEKRLAASMKAMRKAERETGEKKGYLVNVTAETNEMIRRTRLVKKAGNPFVMVELGADWCGPCHIIAGSLDELASKYAGMMKFCRIDADENPVTKGKYSIYYLPTLLFFRNGKLVDQLTGTKAKSEIEQRISLHLQ